MIRGIDRCLIISALALVALLVLAWPGNLLAQRAEADEAPQFEVDRTGEGWFARQLRENKVWPHLDMAYRKEADGDLKGAVKELEAALEHDPVDDNIRFRLMVLFSRLHEDERSAAEAAVLIAAHPEEPLPYLYRAESLRRLGRSGAARDDLRALARMPNLTPEVARQVRLSLVDQYLAEGAFAEALEQIEVLEGAGRDSRLSMSRGLALSGLGRRREALEAFRKSAAEASGKDERKTALLAAAEEAISLKDFTTARSLLETVQETTGKTADLSARLGNLAAKDHDDRAAAVYFREAVDQGDLEARESLLIVLDRLGRLDEAESLARDLVAQAGTPEQKAAGLRTLGALRERQGRYQAAAEAFEQAGRLAPTAETWLALARTRERLGRMDQARDAYERALTLAPDAGTRFELGMLLSRYGQNRQALDVLQEALNQGLTGKDRLTALKQIGFLAMSEKDYPLAEKTLKEVEALEPDDSSLDRSLADAASGEGRYAEAALRYERAWKQDPGRDPELLQRVAESWAAAGRHAQAEQAYRRLLQESGLSTSERVKSWLAIGYLSQKQGKPAAGALALLNALKEDENPADRYRILFDAANLYLAAGNKTAALDLLRQALREGLPPGPERAGALMQLADAELAGQRADKWTRALPYLREAAAQPGLTARFSAGIQDSLGFVETQLGHFKNALGAFRKSIRLAGATPTRLMGMGLAQRKLGRLPEALYTFQKAVALGGGAKAWIAMAEVYGEMKKPGLAVDALQRVEPEWAGLSAEERRVVFGQYGYYLEELKRPACAREWYQKSLAIGPDQVTAFHLARVERQLGNPGRAVELLDRISSRDLPEDYQAQYLAERARGFRDLGDIPAAKAAYDQALSEYPEADLWSELGGIFREEGDRVLAMDAFAHALTLRRSPAFLMSLGYEELALEYLEAARVHLTEAVEREPNYLSLNRDLGYLNMRLFDNDLAVEHFMTAIDETPLHTIETEEEYDDLIENVHRMRGEVRALNNQFDADLWLTYTSGESGTQGVLPGSGQDVVRTSSGLELAWIPPVIGFRDHRIFKVISRVAWNFDPDSLDVDRDSWSGALGVRYKPFKSQNINIGLERLFGFTDETEDNWVVRLMGSWSDGTDDPSPLWCCWNYSFLFGETDAYLDSPSRMTFYTEGRQGISFKLAHNLVLTPFAVADVRWATHSGADDVSFYEGGLGLSTKFYFDETKYERPRRSVELLMSYKLGRIFDSENIQDENIDAFFSTLLFHF